MLHRYTSTAAALLLTSAQTTLAVMSLEGYQAEKHHRFDNNPAFIGSGYDWSGIARSSNGRWVTMISETCFISTNHAAPGVGNSVVFHEDNDPLGSTISRTVSSVSRIGNTDLVIGSLSSAPGASIAIYSIASNTINEMSFSSSVYSDREAFAVGLNDTGSGTTQFRVGRNELDGFLDNTMDILGAIGDAITFDNDQGTAQSLGADEAFLQGGDSGAPMFVTSSNELVLTGINWFISTPPDVPIALSGTSFVPNYITEIQAEMALKGETLTFTIVPEPTTSLTLFLSSILWLGRHRR